MATHAACVHRASPRNPALLCPTPHIAPTRILYLGSWPISAAPWSPSATKSEKAGTTKEASQSEGSSSSEACQLRQARGQQGMED